MARNSGFTDFIKAFNTTYDTVGRVANDYELAKVANAKPEDVNITAPTMEGFQGQAPDASGAVSQYDQADAPMAVQKGVKFLGKYYASLSDDQMNTARQQAMAGLLMKTDPERGLNMMRDITRDARDTQRFDFETKRANREEKAAGLAEQDADTLRKVDEGTADWMKKRLTNPDGTQRGAGVDDHLAATQYRIGALVSAGRVKDATAATGDFLHQAYVKTQLDTAQRDTAIGQTAAALANGDLGAVKDFYNKFVPDGAHVTDVSKDAKTGMITIQRQTVDGQPLPPTTMKPEQLTAGLVSFKDPKALMDFSYNEFNQNMQRRQMDNQERSTSIQAGSAASTAALQGAQLGEIKRKTAEGEELASIHADRSAAIDSGDKQAEAAADKKLAGYLRSGKGSQHLSQLEQKAQLYLQSGDAKTLSEALAMANQKVQSSAKDDYIKWTTGAMPLQGEQLDNAMALAHGPDWKGKMQGTPAAAGGASAPKISTKAEFDKLPSGSVYTGEDGKKYKKP